MATFLQEHPIIVTPVSWRTQFVVDQDQQSVEVFAEMLEANSPMLSVAFLGLPGLSVPTGVVDGLPTAVQVVADVFREDVCFDAGEAIERAVTIGTPIDPRSP